MMKVGFIASANGLGHLRRLICIALEFKKLSTSCVILLPCQLPTDSVIPKLVSDFNLDSKIICSNDYIDGPFTKFQSHDTCKSIFTLDRLDYFDVLISDTVLIDTGKSPIKKILVAQFIWECNSRTTLLLDSYRKIFGFNYFTQEYILRLSNFSSVPLLDYWKLSAYSKKSFSHQICVANSGAVNVLDYLPSEILLQHFPIIYGLDSYLKNNNKPLAVVCRPGLGAILECLSSGIIPILIKSSDPELNHNLNICVKNNWGVALEDFLKVPTIHRIEFLLNFKYLSESPLFIQRDTYVRDYLLPALNY
jgi:hypothetical protein